MPYLKTHFLTILTLIALASLVGALCCGSVWISLGQFYATLTGHGDALSQTIILHLRLPRALSAFVTGGLLALSGTLMQALLANPLADPYILGISGGAAAASLLLILFGISGLWLTAGAWAGSLCALLGIIYFTKRFGPWDKERLLLTGVALASGFSALISLLLVLSPDRTVFSMLFWLLGDLSYAHVPLLGTLILIIALGLSLTFAKELNLIIRGPYPAMALGVDPKRIHYKLLLLSSLCAAAAVSLAGTIGFIGLIIPHLCRLLGGYDHRWVLPASVLSGGILLTCADTVARTAFAPTQLPVGIMIACLGIPVFIFLLAKKRL